MISWISMSFTHNTSLLNQMNKKLVSQRVNISVAIKENIIIRIALWTFTIRYNKQWWSTQTKMPSHQKKYNIEIELKSEKTLNFELLYSMSWEELQVLWQYLNKHLAKSFIQSSYFLFAFSMLFTKKSDIELHFCINYQALNAIIIWNQYSIFLIQENIKLILENTIFYKTQYHCCLQSNSYTRKWQKVYCILNMMKLIWTTCNAFWFEEWTQHLSALY